MKCYMTDEEIKRDYQRAKDKKRQMSILADMNLCSVEQMREKLVELGVLETEETAEKNKPDEKTAKKRERKSAEQTEKAATQSPEKAAAMTAATLGSLLLKLDTLYSGAEMTVHGHKVSGVIAKMRFDGKNDDTPTSMSLELEVLE